MTAQTTKVLLGADPSAQNLQLTINGTPCAQPTVFDLSDPSVALRCLSQNTVALQLSGGQSAQQDGIAQGICVAIVPPIEATITPSVPMAMTFSEAAGPGLPTQTSGGPLLLSLYNEQIAHLTVQAGAEQVAIPPQSGNNFPLGSGTVTVECNAGGHVTVTLTPASTPGPATIQGDLSICITPNTRFTLTLQSSIKLTFRGLGSALLATEGDGNVHPLHLGVKCADDL